MRLKNVGRTVLVDPRQTVAAHKAWYYSFSVALASGEGVPMTEHGKLWFDPRAGDSERANVRNRQAGTGGVLRDATPGLTRITT